MKKIIIIFTYLLLMFTSCNNKQEKQNILFEEFGIAKEMHPEWKDLFTDKYEITPLETRSDCLLGQIEKIKKINGHYFIYSSSNQSIYQFDKQGKFVSSLSKMGPGPEEYIRIEDFDVYNVNGETEVWISDNKNLKVYDADNFTFKYRIPYSFIIHKFKRLENAHILLVTGESKNILTLTDKEGNIISEYQKKEIPFIMFRPIQFIAYKSDYLFQLGISNTFVAFNPQTEDFQKCTLSKDKTYLSDRQLLDLFNKYGTDFILEANNSSYINNIIALNNIAWIQTCNLGNNYLTKIEDGHVISTQFSYGSILSTITVGDSDNSILLYINPDQIPDIPKEIMDKHPNKIDYRQDDNPLILEFF